MRGTVLSLSQLSSILVVGLLVLSTHALWAQGKLTEERVVQLPDAPSEAQTHPPLTNNEFPLSFRQNQGQAGSWMRFFPDRTGYDRPSINRNAVLSQDTRTAQVLGKNRYFIASPLTKWMTFASMFGHVPHETIRVPGDLEYAGHYIPWASSAILRIGQQAKAHPRITTVIKMVHPQF